MRYSVIWLGLDLGWACVGLAFLRAWDYFAMLLGDRKGDNGSIARLNWIFIISGV